MKSVTDVLHRTPWWALIFAALATFVALAVFVIPYHILHYKEDAKSSDESRAIQREIDNTFAENAINVGRNVVKGMLARTKDPDRRAELEAALKEFEPDDKALKKQLEESLKSAQKAEREAEQALNETKSRRNIV